MCCMIHLLIVRRDIIWRWLDELKLHFKWRWRYAYLDLWPCKLKLFFLRIKLLYHSCKTDSSISDQTIIKSRMWPNSLFIVTIPVEMIHTTTSNDSRSNAKISIIFLLKPNPCYYICTNSRYTYYYVRTTNHSHNLPYSRQNGATVCSSFSKDDNLSRSINIQKNVQRLSINI